MNNLCSFGEWMNGWMNDWMNEWMNEWIVEWISEWMNQSLIKCQNEWIKSFNCSFEWLSLMINFLNVYWIVIQPKATALQM